VRGGIWKKQNKTNHSSIRVSSFFVCLFVCLFVGWLGGGKRTHGTTHGTVAENRGTTNL
jgi:hypothetical protein